MMAKFSMVNLLLTNLDSRPLFQARDLHRLLKNFKIPPNHFTHAAIYGGKKYFFIG
jgi:hypothetical protein